MRSATADFVECSLTISSLAMHVAGSQFVQGSTEDYGNRVSYTRLEGSLRGHYSIIVKVVRLQVSKAFSRQSILLESVSCNDSIARMSSLPALDVQLHPAHPPYTSP